MPISEHNCVDYAISALKSRYKPQTRRLRPHSIISRPSDATIVRYIRACRHFDRYHDLLSRITEERLASFIPLHFLYSRGYKWKKKNQRSGLDPPDRDFSFCPFTLPLFNLKDGDHEQEATSSFHSAVNHNPQH